MLSLAIDSLHQINCLRSKGYLSVIASGGVTPYTYTWSNGTTGPLDANLDIGSYDISVVDGNGAIVAINVQLCLRFNATNVQCRRGFYGALRQFSIDIVR